MAQLLQWCDSVWIPRQGYVRKDFWERRGGGHVPGPANPMQTVATNASVCVTASVVSAVWLQVTISMHVCLQLSLKTIVGLAIKTVCMGVCISASANI